MSYILDALKRADRERNLAKVPTLTSVHVPVYVTGRRLALWLIIGGVLLGGGALAWWLRPAPTETPAPVVHSQQGVGISAQTRVTEPDRGPASGEVLSLPPAVVAEPAPSTARVGSRPEAPRRTDSRLTPSGRSNRPGPRQTAQPSAAPAPVQPEQAEVRAVESAPPSSPSVPPAPSPVVEWKQDRAGQVAVAPPAVPSSAPTLREALPRMTLDVFVYTDVEADRMAVINGRRYIKGQLVDGLYLVEGINPEGVVMSYKGERAVLRP